MLWLLIVPLIVLVGLIFVYSLVKPLRNAPPVQTDATRDDADDIPRYRECRDLDE